MQEEFKYSKARGILCIPGEGSGIGAEVLEDTAVEVGDGGGGALAIPSFANLPPPEGAAAIDNCLQEIKAQNKN